MTKNSRNILTGFLSKEKSYRKCDMCLKMKTSHWFKRILFSKPNEIIICDDCAKREANAEYLSIREEIDGKDND